LGNARNIAFWVVLFLLVLALFNLFSGGQGTMQTNGRSYSDFVADVNSGAVARVTLDGETVRYTGTDGRDYTTVIPADAQVTELLIAEGVPVTARSQEQSGVTSFLLSLLGLFHEPDARRRARRRDGLWQITRQTADRKAGPDHL
jgi:cell division protease FtsH